MERHQNIFVWRALRGSREIMYSLHQLISVGRNVALINLRLAMHGTGRQSAAYPPTKRLKVRLDAKRNGRFWPGRAKAGLKFIAGNRPSAAIRQGKVGADRQRPLLAGRRPTTERKDRLRRGRDAKCKTRVQRPFKSAFR